MEKIFLHPKPCLTQSSIFIGYWKWLCSLMLKWRENCFSFYLITCTLLKPKNPLTYPFLLFNLNLTITCFLFSWCRIASSPSPPNPFHFSPSPRLINSRPRPSISLKVLIFPIERRHHIPSVRWLLHIFLLSLPWALPFSSNFFVYHFGP